MKKMIVCAVIAGLFTGVASAKGLDDVDKSTIGVGSFVGLGIIAFSYGYYKDYNNSDIKFTKEDWNLFQNSWSDTKFKNDLNNYLLRDDELNNSILKRLNYDYFADYVIANPDYIDGKFRQFNNIRDDEVAFMGQLDEKVNNGDITEEQVREYFKRSNLVSGEKRKELMSKFNQSKSAFMEEEIANGNSGVSLNQGPDNPAELKKADAVDSGEVTTDAIGNGAKITTENEKVEGEKVETEVKEEKPKLEDDGLIGE